MTKAPPLLTCVLTVNSEHKSRNTSIILKLEARTLAGRGDLEGSSVKGVCIAVRRGGHEWVISYKEEKKKKKSDMY